MAWGSKAEIQAAVEAAIKTEELQTAGAGALAYMLSKQTYLNNRVGHWLPYLMFFTPETDPKLWDAGLPELTIATESFAIAFEWTPGAA